MKRRGFLRALLALPLLSKLRPAEAAPELQVLDQHTYIEGPPPMWVSWEEPGIASVNPAAVSKLSMGCFSENMGGGGGSISIHPKGIRNEGSIVASRREVALDQGRAWSSWPECSIHGKACQSTVLYSHSVDEPKRFRCTV